MLLLLGLSFGFSNAGKSKETAFLVRIFHVFQAMDMLQIGAWYY